MFVADFFLDEVLECAVFGWRFKLFRIIDVLKNVRNGL